MKILILNWRSIKDPLQGGAELATFEFAKRWTRDYQAEITWLSPVYDKNIKEETIDGIKFKYIGSSLNRNLFTLVISFPIFYFLVFWTYLTKFKNHVDVVIDQVHGIPYLTPLYVKEKIIVYIHEVAGEIWDLMYPFPVNLLGKIIEKIIFIPYRKTDFVGTEIVADDLVKIGIPKKNIHTVYYGVTAPNIISLPHKNKDLTVVFLNRLVKMKGPERAIEVFKLVFEKDHQAQLIFVGRGEPEYENNLKKIVKKLGLEDNVTFKGFVSTEEKLKILGDAHVLINASYKEGWGLVNIEANRMGTPVVTFNVKGNNTSVRNGVSGFIFDENEYEKMADKIVELKDDQKLQQASFEYSKQFDWDKVSKKFYEILH